MMRKLIDRGNGLLLKSKYNYVPVSNYEVQKKQNPIIEVTLGSQTGKHFNIHFRVCILRCSSFKILSPKQRRISKDCFLGLLFIKIEVLHLQAIIFIMLFQDLLLSLATQKEEIVQFMALLLEINHSNYPTTDLAFSAVSVRKIQTIADLLLLSRHVLSWT